MNRCFNHSYAAKIPTKLLAVKNPKQQSANFYQLFCDKTQQQKHLKTLPNFVFLKPPAKLMPNNLAKVCSAKFT